jgi:hypothetical protein
LQLPPRRQTPASCRIWLNMSSTWNIDAESVFYSQDFPSHSLSSLQCINLKMMMLLCFTWTHFDLTLHIWSIWTSTAWEMQRKHCYTSPMNLMLWIESIWATGSMVQNPKDQIEAIWILEWHPSSWYKSVFSWDTMGLVLFKARVVMALARWSSKNSSHNV